MNKTTIIFIIIALIIGAFGGYAVERFRATAKMEEYKLLIQKQMDTAQKMTENKDNMMTTTTPAMSETIMMAKTTGIVTDTKGMTVYTYDKDSKNVSNCTQQCLANWPAFVVTEQAPSTLPTNLGTFKRTDGTTQYTWKGMPLYYYIGDKKAGDTTGDGLGGVWHVVK